MATALPMPARRSPAAPPGLWRSWTLATAAGELLGFAIPSVVWATVWLTTGEPESGAGRLGFYLLMIAAGAGEGAVLGLCQWSALRRVLPAVSRRAWLLATAAPATFAWSIGMLPSTLGDALESAPPWLLIPVAVVLASALLTSIGGGQWLVLRHQLPRAWRWVPANVLAWFAGLPVTFIVPALLPDDAPAALMLTAAIASGVTMGVIVGAVTGWALVRMTREAGT